MEHLIKFGLKTSIFILIMLPLKSLASDETTIYSSLDFGYVTDNANLLSNDEEEMIERWLWQAEMKSHVEIAIVTISSIIDYSETYSESINSFVKQLLHAYKIGEESNNEGLLLLIVKDEKKAETETGIGYNSSRNLDAEAIVDNIILPKIKEENYAESITKGSEALIEEFANLQIRFPWHLVQLKNNSLPSNWL